VWTDTTFDADRMEAVPVSFGSEDYFALIAARPEWGRYLALGDHVIVVLDDTAYEIREGEAPPLDVPAAESTPTAEPTAAESSSNLFEKIVQAVLELLQEIIEQFAP
jgi:hypothetical protein